MWFTKVCVFNLLLSVSLFNNQKTVDYPLGVWIGTGYTIQFDYSYRANDSMHRDYIKFILIYYIALYVNASFIYSFINFVHFYISRLLFTINWLINYHYC